MSFDRENWLSSSGERAHARLHVCPYRPQSPSMVESWRPFATLLEPSSVRRPRPPAAQDGMRPQSRVRFWLWQRNNSVHRSEWLTAYFSSISLCIAKSELRCLIVVELHFLLLHFRLRLRLRLGFWLAVGKRPCRRTVEAHELEKAARAGDDERRG